MNANKENYYKDENPLNTIHTIRSILNSIGAFPIEKQWFNEITGFYSIHLEIPNTGIFSNGKGVNYQLALASAYGEFIERLQNQLIYRNKISFPKNIEAYYGFKYSPDEVCLSIQDFMNKQKNEIDVFCPTNQINQLMSVEQYTLDSKLISVPFYNVMKEQVCYVPLAVLDIHYGSNGMCAGNTAEEAILEGICELLERYAKSMLLKGEVNPPDIPEEYLQKYRKTFEMVRNFEQHSKYKIWVKDCSCGLNFPIVGVLAIEKQSQKYFWSLGCHPVFEIALSRALTEMLQGRNSIDYKFNHFIFSSKDETKLKNRINAFKDGNADYPCKLFTNKFSYDFSQYPDYVNMSNKQLLKVMIDLLNHKNWQLIVRNVSFLQFPSYQVIIPQISELTKVEEIRLDKFLDSFEVTKIIQKIKHISDKELRFLVDFIEKYCTEKKSSLISFLKVPLNTTFYLHNVETNLFRCMAYYKLKQFDKSFLSINNYISSLGDCSNEVRNYYKCVRDYIGGINDQYHISDIECILKKFYDENLVDSVLDDMKDSSDVFKNFTELDCWNCEKCINIKICSYKTVEKLHLAIKQKYMSAKINQNALKDVFY